MKKKNIHLQKYLKGPLPEPEVSADDAWAEMNGMLDEEPSDKKGKYKLRFLAALLGLMGIVLIVWVLYSNSGGELHTKDASNVNAAAKSKSSRQSSDKPEGGRATEKNQHSVPDEKANNVAGALPEINEEKETKLIGEAGVGRPGFEKGKPTISRPRNDKTKADFGARNSISKDVAVREDGGRGRMEEGVVTFLAANTVETDKVAAAGKALDIAKKADARWAGHIHLLQPKSFRFSAFESTITVKNQVPNQGEQVKTEKLLNPFQSFLRTIHFGLEWNAASSFRDTRYIFAGADSVSRSYLLAIPGLWLNKGVGRNQSVTLSIFAYQPYFGGLKQIRKDSIRGSDSTFSYRQTKLVKAAGFNVSVLYNYHFSSLGMLSAGFGYSALRNALLREDSRNNANEVHPGALVSVRKNEIGEFIKTNLFTFKTGLAFTPGRFQLGVNLVIPITNLSLSETSLKTVNGQVLIRYRIK